MFSRFPVVVLASFIQKRQRTQLQKSEREGENNRKKRRERNLDKS